MLRTQAISNLWRLLPLLLAPLLLTGCSWLKTPKLELPPASSPLAELRPKSEQIVLDVIFVRLSPREAATVDSIWQDVDEQAIPGETRLSLARNGYRVGLLGRALPSSLSKLLSTAEDPTANGRSLDPAQRNQPGITRHQLYLRPAHRAELVVSPVQAELHALVWRDQGVAGTTYAEGQAQFAIQAEPTPNGRTELRMIPEVHHGSLQQHYTSGEAMFRLDNRRQRESFDDLAILASLAPGEVMLMGRRATRTGTLGDRFFGSTEPAQVAERLLLIRLSEKVADPLFADPDSPASPPGTTMASSDSEFTE